MKGSGLRSCYSQFCKALPITLRCLDVEVAIHLKGFDFFRELKGLLYFVRCYLNFLAIETDANRHGESLNDSVVVKRNALPVHAVFQQGNLCGPQVLVKYFAEINTGLSADIRFNLFRGNGLMPKLSTEPAQDGEPFRV